MKEKIEIIQDWMAAPLYWRGVEIYELYGDSGFLKKLFRSSEDDYNREKLNAALQEILETSTVQEIEVVASMPASLQTKLETGKRLLDERTALKERLRVYYHQDTNVELTKGVAFAILDINAKLNEIFDEERFYKSTGYLPERVAYNGDTIQELYKRRNNLRTYLSRTTNLEKLEGFKKEMFAVEKKIEAMTNPIKKI